MTTEYQAAMATLAADTKRACATSADIVKAAKAKAAAKTAQAAQAAQAAKVAKVKAAHATKAAQAAKVTHAAKVNKVTHAAKVKAVVKPAAKGFSFHAKAAFFTHPVAFSLVGGAIIGIVAYRLVNKYWLQNSSE